MSVGKPVKKDKNAGCISRMKKLITRYHPEVIVLEDSTAKDTRRSPRIQELWGKIIEMAQNLRVPVRELLRKQVRRAFFDDGPGTKHALAEILATKFPDELGDRLPPKRRPWTSEDYRIDIFDAVALALVQRLEKRRTKKRHNRLETNREVQA